MHYLSLGFIAAIIASLGYVERAEAVDARIRESSDLFLYIFLLTVRCSYLVINHAEAGANWCNSVWPHAWCVK
jgi:hypothetical protein